MSHKAAVEGAVIMICAKNKSFYNKSTNKHTSLANYVFKAQKGNSYQGFLAIE